MARDQQGLEVTGAAAPRALDARRPIISPGRRSDRNASGGRYDPAFNLGGSAIASLFLLNGFRGDNPAR